MSRWDDCLIVSLSDGKSINFFHNFLQNCFIFSRGCLIREPSQISLVMSPSWNIPVKLSRAMKVPSQAKPSWGTLIFELKLS